jgi:hypothetical protein
LARERNARILATIELKQQRCRAIVQLLRSSNVNMIGIVVFAIRGFENLWIRKQGESLNYCTNNMKKKLSQKYVTRV